MRSRRADEVGGITPCVLSVQQWVTNWGEVLLPSMVSMKFRILRSVDQFRILTEGAYRARGDRKRWERPIINTFSYSRVLLLTGSFWKVPDTDSWLLKWTFFSQSYKRKKHDFSSSCCQGRRWGCTWTQVGFPGQRPATSLIPGPSQ